MTRKILMRTLFLLAVMLALASTGAAQDAPETEPSAFLRLLSAVPAGEYVENANPQVSFGAYHEAITAAGLDIPQDWDDYRISDPAAVDAAVYSVVRGGLGTFDTYGDRYVEIVGFDFFEVEYAAAFGVPPYTGIVLAGEFDTDAVIAAHTARGYTIEALDGGTLLCPPDGCDTGKVVNPAAMDPANPFGGGLGRSEPVFVADGLILNSPDIAVLEAMIAAYEGSAESLADLPEFQALAAALAETVYHSLEVFGPSEDSLPVPARNEAEELLGTVPLPVYRIGATANGVDESGRTSTFLLVYSDSESAGDAAAAIDVRVTLPVVISLIDPEIVISYSEWFEKIGMSVQSAQVYLDPGGVLPVVILNLLPVERSVEFDPVEANLYSPQAWLFIVIDTE
jgi:hypothetical protein